jgi:hypothetical protein
MKAVGIDNLRDHSLLVVRSRALHRAVAEKIRAHPELLAVARQNVERWIAEEQKHGGVSPGLLEWQRILSTLAVEEILELLCEETDEADRLRHSTPFCGILTEPEREAIYRHYAALPA